MSKSSNHPICVHVIISGRVQGVGYRYATTQTAAKLGIKGWVKNLPNGDVEAVFEGHPDRIAEILSWCWQGSAPAIVENVRVENQSPENLQNFEIRK